MPVQRTAEGRLELGGVDLGRLAQDPSVGTPSYVYDLGAIAEEAKALHDAFAGAPHLVAYAVKANSAGAVVRVLVSAGCGADVVSGAELALAAACGARPEAILFSGVAKQDDELDQAVRMGESGIGAIQIESVEELGRVSVRAREAGRRARISLRINPEASLEMLDTHAHIATGHDEAKFGIPKDDVAAAVDIALRTPDLALVGLSAHIGSQLTRTGGYVTSARTLFEVAKSVRGRVGAMLSFVDTGGGFGIDYGDGCAATPADFVRETRPLMAAHGLSDLALYVEPGRSLVGAHGVLLAKVVQHKATPYAQDSVGGEARRRWLMIDAGMNDLMRPALYQARHRVVPLEMAISGPRAQYRVVGPVCESSDDFGEHALPLEPPRHVALLDAGAYGYTMASRYNGRALPAEVFVAEGKVVSVRRRAPMAVWVEDRVG